LLQHSPPQIGTPPPDASPVVALVQIVPAGGQVPTPVAPATEQVPSVAPAALVHRPPQQSRLFAHASPFWMQNDTRPSQIPLRQFFEQHSWFVMQALLAVLHELFRGTHLPPPQFALQHSAEFEHAWPSEVHVELPHDPALQTKVQQSRGLAHEPPAGLQPPSEPPPPTVEPPAPALAPPFPALEPPFPALEPPPPVFDPAKPPAPPPPPDPVVSVGVPPSLPPQVTSTTVENNVTAPARNSRWIM
jgi:hypothetical protein